MDILKLTNENIDLMSEKVGEMYERAGSSKKEIMRARLLLEESLIKYQKHFGEETEFYVRQYSLLGQSRLILNLRTPSFDPFSLEENPMAFMIESVMSTFEGNMPTWKFKNAENELVFSVRRKAKGSALLKLGIICVVALLLGFLSRTFLPVDKVTSIIQNYVDPLTNAYTGLFCVMAVLLTLFAIVLSIVRIGDLAVVGKLAGRVMGRFYMMAGILVLVLVLPILPTMQYSESGGISLAVKSIYDILIGFIPANLVAPFLDFNSVHIMIVGAMFGFSLLYMGQKGSTLVSVFSEANMAAVYTNNFLNKFIGIYVGLKIYSMILTSDFSTLSSAGRIAALIVIGQVLIFLFYTIYVRLRTKIPTGDFLRAAMPSVLVCLSSANFGAAVSSVFDGMIKLDSMNDETSFAFTVGSVIFRPACMVVFVYSAFEMAELYGVSISVVWVIMAILLSIILIAAVPNIPGMSVAVVTLLFSQLGLPAEAIALMIAINAPLQFLTVATDCYCLFSECICLAKGKHKMKLFGR